MPDVFVAPKPQSETTPPPEEAPNVVQEQPVQQQRIDDVASINPIPQVLRSDEIPFGIHFEAQQPNENILLSLRRDKVTNVPWIAASVLFIIGPILLTILLRFTNINIPFFAGGMLFFVMAFYYLTIMSYMFVNYIVWYYNISLITNLRVIDIDFTGLTYKNVSVTRNNEITDVSFKQISALNTVFDYGNVLIQTQGAQDEFTLDAVPRPAHIVDVIQALIRDVR